MTRKSNSAEVSSAVIHVDGACKGNPGPASIGVSITDENGESIRELSEFIGSATNNIAEYFSLIYGLTEAVSLRMTHVQVYTDSQLMARQFSGEYKVKEPHVKMLHRIAKKLSQYFLSCKVQHIPREQNKVADRLANAAMEDLI